MKAEEVEEGTEDSQGIEYRTTIKEVHSEVEVVRVDRLDFSDKDQVEETELQMQVHHCEVICT